MAIEAFLKRFIELLLAPRQNIEMIWIALPLITSMILAELYFGRYNKEQLGWNTALSNSLVLVFVGLDLLKIHYSRGEFLVWNLDFSISLGILIWGTLLLYLNFFHMMPERFAFMVSNFVPINMLAYLALALVYADIPLDYFTIVSGAVLIGLVWLLFMIVHVIEPKAEV